MEIFYITTTALAGWVAILAMNISRLRMRERVGIGHGDKVAIKKAIRAHMNSLEQTIPFILLFFVAAKTAAISETALSVLAISFFLSRLINAYSFYSSLTPIRQFSAGISYISIIFLFIVNVISFV